MSIKVYVNPNNKLIYTIVCTIYAKSVDSVSALCLTSCPRVSTTAFSWKPCRDEHSGLLAEVTRANKANTT